MSLLHGIKNYFFFKKVKSLPSLNGVQNKQLVNLDLANTIGVLFDATLAKEVLEVSQYALKLQELGKKVAILGYQNTKDKDLNDSRFFNNCRCKLVWRAG
ncbi:MAG: hypothetical protein LRY27_02040 [Chitinophagales bacterium]|nr:hypothetical protein [Chitinophagales bacterium]